LESTGYSCSETDIHNCLQEVEYATEVCNTGTGDETISEWKLSVNEMENDLLPLGAALFPNNELQAGECALAVRSQDVNRCVSADYNTFLVAAVAESPQDCTDTDALDFGWIIAPTNAPSSSPSASPSDSPSARPSPSPSTPFPTVDPECRGRPWVITFLYNGGGCGQSDNLQPRQKFDCSDVDSAGPPTNAGETSYITAVPRGGNLETVFFAGTVPVGEKYTLNADEVYDKLAADMTITIYDREGGSLLQIVDLHLSCSQPLILFDKFGASEVTQWVETDGRVVSLRASGVVTGVYESDLGVTGSF